MIRVADEDAPEEARRQHAINVSFHRKILARRYRRHEMNLAIDMAAYSNIHGWQNSEHLRHLIRVAVSR